MRETPIFPGNGGTIQVFVNDSPTGLACNIITDGQPNGRGDVVCKDTSHTFKVKPGDDVTAAFSIDAGYSFWNGMQVSFEKVRR
jgi:hypothetical protein